MMLGGNPAALSKSFTNKLKKTANTRLFNPSNTMKSKDQQLSQAESLKLQLKERRKERLSQVLLAVDGIKTKTAEDLEGQQEEKRLRAESEAKRKTDAEHEERVAMHLSKMTENKGHSKTMQLLSKGIGAKE